MTGAAELIRRKRDGGELTADEVALLVRDFARGAVPDYQMAAFCMAVYFRGLSRDETFALTEAMVASGTTLDLRSALGRGAADKHSTGGVGDKTSLVVGPIVAACGLPFAKMAGRGLGHTGGTIDKLESIPGLRTELSADELVAQVRDVGLAIVSASDDLVPADRRLYALRDVTATVDEPSLIAASIMSKKIAAGADAIVLDVKVGAGAFMKTLDDARMLAQTMRELGERAGRGVAAFLTDMDEPLGVTVGNALEVREVAATLQGTGPQDLVKLALTLSARLLALSDLGLDEREAHRRAEQALADGSAFAAYERWIRSQGGDPSLDALPHAPVVEWVTAAAPGFVASVDARAIGSATVALGGGRATKDTGIDHAVGIVCAKKGGAEVDEGEELAAIHARTSEDAARVAEVVRSAYHLRPEPPSPRPVVLSSVD